MSWLARSIVDSLRIHDDENQNNGTSKSQFDHKQNEEEEEDRSGRGVREDLSEFTDTLTRQLWGVASFLAPPPPPPRYGNRLLAADRDRWDPSDYSGSCDDSDGEASDSIGVLETQNEVLSNESSYKVVLDTCKMDSNSLPSEKDDPIGGAVGITEEVLAFALNIAHHPETWLDFPLEEEDDIDDFDMCNAHHEHALAIQRLTPRLAALRIELCPVHMSEGYFWKVYFVLLHSRINKQDAELLSTPQIMSARAMWMQQLQKRTKKETYGLGRGTSYVKETTVSWQESYDHVISDDAPENTSLGTFSFEPATYFVNTKIDTEMPTAMKPEDKDLVATPSFKIPVHNSEDDDDDNDDWLREDSELDGYSGAGVILGSYEDVSFSDLEDDDGYTTPRKPKIV
ncbi:hypothetical protein U1Q18_016420 [Sarracenia purpurea var. burkii]